MTFGATILRARKEAFLSQAFVAQRLGISKQYLSDMENDRRGPPGDPYILQLANTLHVPADVLYYRAGKLPPYLPADVSQAQILAAFRALRLALDVPFHGDRGAELPQKG